MYLMMNPLYSSWNNALDYSRYPRGNLSGNTAATVLPQMHYRYRGSAVHSVPSPRYYREILPIPTVISAVTAVLPHSPLPCHSLVLSSDRVGIGYVPPTDTGSLCLAVDSTRTAVPGLFRSLVRRSGTHCSQMNSEIRRVMSTASNSSLKQSCSAFTSVTSAL